MRFIHSSGHLEAYESMTDRLEGAIAARAKLAAILVLASHFLTDILLTCAGQPY